MVHWYDDVCYGGDELLTFTNGSGTDFDLTVLGLGNMGTCTDFATGPRESGINQTTDSRAILETMNCPVTQIMEVGEAPVDMMVGFTHDDASSAAISHILTQGRRRIAAEDP